MELCLILILTFILRILPKLYLKSSISLDAYFHLFLKNTIRENGNVPEKLERILLNNNLVYPFGFHKLLSAIPKKYDLWIDTISSAILDSIYVAIVYFFAYYTFSDPQIALYSSLLVSLSPIFLRVSNAPRAYNVTPRVFGELLILIFFISLISFSTTNNYIWLLLSILIVPLNVLSSKFSSQVLLFFSICLLIFGNYYALFSLFIGLIIGYLLFGKVFIEIIKAHYYHSSFYYKYNQKKYLWPLKLSVQDYKLLIKRKFKEKKFLQWLYQENYLYHQLVFLYWPFFIILISITHKEYSVIEKEFLIYISISLFLTLLISIKKFLFLGEAERYLEHTVFAQSILLSSLLIYFNLEYILIIYLIQSILGYFFYLGIHKQYYSQAHLLFEEMKEIAESIDHKNTTVLPIAGLHWIVLYFSKNLKVIMTLNDNERKFPYNKWKKILGNYPFPGSKVLDIQKEFNYNYIIIRNDRIDQYHTKLNDNVFISEELQLINKKELVSLYKIKDKNEHK